MGFERQFTAKQAAEAVLKKTQELLEKSELAKAERLEKCKGGTFSKVHAAAEREGYSEESSDKIAGKAKAMEKYESENSKKLEYKLPEAGRNEKQPEKSDQEYEVHPDKPANALGPESAASHSHPAVQKGEEDRLNEQKDPQHNPKEQAEGNNELAGTTPTQVGQDGKNIPGGDEIRGHLKLAKFIGRMEHKRGLKKSEMEKAETGHEMGINRQSVSNTTSGVSEAGGRLRTGNKYGSDMLSSKAIAHKDTKDIHKEKLKQMHSMPKPKIPG